MAEHRMPAQLPAWLVAAVVAAGMTAYAADWDTPSAPSTASHPKSGTSLPRSERAAYFEHETALGVIGRGESVEKAFEGAARALFALATDLDAVLATEHLTLELEEADVAIALVRSLNLLCARAREEGLVLGRFHVGREGMQWRIEAWGERRSDAMTHGLELKGVTPAALSVKRVEGIWEARCLVDA